MSVAITITNAGRAALVNAANTGTAAVVIAAIGLSASALAPDPAATSLPNELKRVGAVGGQIVADDVIHVTMTDASTDAYSARSFGIYLADGTLFALYGQADVLLTKTAASQGLLAVDLQFADANAASIAFGPTDWVNPPASESIWGVIKLATAAVAKAGADALTAITPATAKAAILDWLGYTPVQQGGGAGQGGNKIYLGWAAGARLKLQVDNSDQGNILTDAVAAGALVTFNGAWMRRMGMDLWGPDNDGSGSTLDADLLDGQQGAWYADIPSRLGFNPANRAGETFTGNVAVQASQPTLQLRSTSNGRYTNWVLQEDGNLVLYMNTGSGDAGLFNCNSTSGPFNFAPPITRAGNLVWDAGNDGAGSGLDADLFNGLPLSAFARSNNPYLTGTVQFQAVNAYLQSDNSRFLLNFDANDYTNYDRVNDIYTVVIGGQTRLQAPLVGHLYLTSTTGNALLNGNQIWHSGNDGAGSGMDTDLFQGQPPAYYVNIPARLGYTPANAAGQTFWGDISVEKGGNANLYLNSAGVGLVNLCMQQDGNFVFYRDGVGVFSQFSARDQFQFNVPLAVMGNAVWNAGNDGAGSGLDADLFHGRGPGDFALVANTFGYNQGVQNVTGGRQMGQNYVNDTGKPFWMAVNVTYPSAGSNVWVIYVDGVEVGYNSGNPSTNTTGTLYALIPPGSTYSANVTTGNAQLHSWIEWR